MVESSTSMWPNNKSDERLNMHAHVRVHILKPVHYMLFI